MIVDARAFDDEYHDVDLVHRDSEIDHLVSLLEPITAGGIPQNVLVTGPSGVGKSSTTSRVLEELDKSALDVTTAYVDALGNSSPTHLLDELLRDMRRGYDLTATKASKSEYLQRFRDIDDALVLTIDEIDVVDDKSIITSLYELPEVYLVGICVNHDELMTGLDIRVEDRLRNFNHVTFDRYSSSELEDIVQSRVDLAFAESDAVKYDAVASIAEIAGGNARFAIGILREAATQANLHSKWPITSECVNDVTEDAAKEVATRYVEKLGTHQRLLFEIVRGEGDVAAGQLHDEYEAQSSDPKSRSMRRNYLQALERQGLIEQRGSTRDTRYVFSGLSSS